MPSFGLDRAEHVDSHLTFVISPDSVLTPQTGHPWFVEMDHEMGGLQMYSLIPTTHNPNQFVHHYEVVHNKHPRIIGPFVFTDAWMTTKHVVVHHDDDIQVHYSQNLYNPQRAGEKLYFDQQPCPRIEITSSRLIEDREVLQILNEVAPKGCQISSLLQRRS